MLVMPGIAEFRPEVLGTGKRDDHEAPLKEPVGFVSGQGVTEIMVTYWACTDTLLEN